MSPVKFSVVIPLYNKSSSVEHTVKSVLAQTWRDYEIIIVNDGSTDGSDHVVQRINDLRIRVIHQSNAGVSAARNRGIFESNYEYIAFLDADDSWDPTYLEEMERLITDIPDAGMYGCAFDEIHKGMSVSRDFALTDNFRGIIKNYFIHARQSHLFGSSATIIRKEAFLKAGLFDTRLSVGEDIDLWFRIAYYHPVAFYNKVLSHYNTSFPNRAMNRKHDYSHSILSHTSKYSIFEKENEDFKIFINLFRIRYIPELLDKYSLGKQEVVSYLKNINYEGQRFKYRMFMLLPIWIQRIIIYIWKKYRRI